MKLSKKQVANVTENKKDIKKFGNPVKSIEKYIQQGGVANGNVKATFFEDCKHIPDPSELSIHHEKKPLDFG